MYIILESINTQFPYIVVHYPSFTSTGWHKSFDKAINAFTFSTTRHFSRQKFSNKSLEDFIEYINSTSLYKLLGIVDELSNIREQYPEFFI